VGNAKGRARGINELKDRPGKCEGPAGGGDQQVREPEWEMRKTGRGGSTGQRTGVRNAKDQPRGYRRVKEPEFDLFQTHTCALSTGHTLEERWSHIREADQMKLPLKPCIWSASPESVPSSVLCPSKQNMHAEPSHWLHEISISTTVRHHINWGYLFNIRDAIFTRVRSILKNVRVFTSVGANSSGSLMCPQKNLYI